MAQLRQAYEDFVKRDTEIVVVGPDSPQRFQTYWERAKLPFIGLADPKHTVADRYGQQVKILKLGRMPAMMILDKQGRVRFVQYAEGMKDYPKLEELYTVLDSLRTEANRSNQKIA